MMLKLAWLTLAVAVGARAKKDSWGGPPYGKGGVPGTGYGCDRPCGGPDDPDAGDVQYTVRAVIRTHEIENTINNDNFQNGELPDGVTLVKDKPFKAKGRTWEGVPEESDRAFCRDMDGTDGILGPCLQYYRGDKVKFRLINDMQDGMEELNQQKEPVQAYLNLATREEGIAPVPQNPEGMMLDEENMPGWINSYDDINIHWHGMEIVPHLFHPQGTSDPLADWITIKPGECYCYAFTVPDDHPQGTYLHHTHKHGSSTIQAWSGMVGMILVGDEDTDESGPNELKNQGVTRNVDFVLWALGLLDSTRVAPDSNTWIGGDFSPQIYGTGSPFNLDPNNDLYPTSPSVPVVPTLTNNGYQPTFDGICVGEIINFRIVNAQADARSTLYVIKDTVDGLNLDDQEVVDLYVWASDGIAFDKPFMKQVIPTVSGQRQEVLMQFAEAGRYLIMNRKTTSGPGIGFLQGPKIQAFIEVNDCGGGPFDDPMDFVFTPGKATDITDEEMLSDIDITFKQTYVRNQAPFLQFDMNNKAYDTYTIDQVFKVGTASRWTVSTTHGSFHPIHLHVNPFQVEVEKIASTSESVNVVVAKNSTSNITWLDAVKEWPPLMWRDTMQVPGDGRIVIRNRFEHWIGKTVYHCHLLSHEDSGMMANMQIEGYYESKKKSKSSKKKKNAKKGYYDETTKR